MSGSKDDDDDDDDDASGESCDDILQINARINKKASLSCGGSLV